MDNHSATIRLAPGGFALQLSIPTPSGRTHEYTIAPDERGLQTILSVLRRMSHWQQPCQDAKPVGEAQAKLILSAWNRVCRHEQPLDQRCFQCEGEALPRDYAGKAQKFNTRGKPAKAPVAPIAAMTELGL